MAAELVRTRTPLGSPFCRAAASLRPRASAIWSASVPLSRSPPAPQSAPSSIPPRCLCAAFALLLCSCPLQAVVGFGYGTDPVSCPNGCEYWVVR